MINKDVEIAELKELLRVKCEACKLYQAEKRRKAKADENAKLIEMQGRPVRRGAVASSEGPWPAKSRDRWGGEYE